MNENEEILKNKSILVADDFPEMRELYKDILEYNGLKITTAKDGQEAIDIFFENPFDLVILDIFMPKKNGIEVIKEITKEFPKIKIIAVTGGSDDHQNEIENYLEDANHQGASICLKKPVEPTVMLENVIKLLKDS